jgi:uncharacterized protein (TIGR02246 family)
VKGKSWMMCAAASWMIAAILSPTSSGEAVRDEGAIRDLLDRGAADWSRGDLDAFMSGYEDAPTTTFVGAAKVTKGFKQIRDSYHARYAAEGHNKMGTMSVTDLEVRMLGQDYALAIGKWNLTRTAEEGGNASGYFTLTLRKTGAGWRIVVDHTP